MASLYLAEVLLKRFPPQVTPLPMNVSCLSKGWNLRMRPYSIFCLILSFSWAEMPTMVSPTTRPLRSSSPQKPQLFLTNLPSNNNSYDLRDLHQSSQTRIQLNTTADSRHTHWLFCKLLLPPSLQTRTDWGNTTTGKKWMWKFCYQVMDHYYRMQVIRFILPNTRFYYYNSRRGSMKPSHFTSGRYH